MASLGTSPAHDLEPDARSFLPSRHGFAFANSFEVGALRSPVAALAGALAGESRYGLCGGMSAAAADFFLAGLPVPDGATPPEPGTPLHDYLARRQADSFGAVGEVALRFAAWSALRDDGPFGGRARTCSELRSIRARLDRGEPAVLGLVTVSIAESVALWSNHQVLAFALEADDGLEAIRVYDPNYPGRDDVRLAFRTTLEGVLTLPAWPAVPAPVLGAAAELRVGQRPARPVRGVFEVPYRRSRPPAGLVTAAPASRATD